jgi:hypothetical protein
MEYLEQQREELLQQAGRYYNGQAQVLFPNVFLPYIARCGYTEEERLGIYFEELDKMWCVAHELVIFKSRCFSLPCVLNTCSTGLKADCEFHDTAILLKEELLTSVGCQQREIMFWGNINPKNDLKI